MRPIDYAERFGRDHVKPCHHTARVNGYSITFANLEYAADKPPKVIEIDGLRWVREDEDT